MYVIFYYRKYNLVLIPKFFTDYYKTTWNEADKSQLGNDSGERF